MSHDLKQRIDSLTDTDLSCLALVAQHLRTPEIAGRLGLTDKAVDNRIGRAMKRLGVSDRDSAVRLLIEASHAPWGKSLAAFSSLGTPLNSTPGTFLSRLPWPWPTEWRPENDHGFAAKLALVVALASAMMLAVAAYLGVVLMIDRNTGRSSHEGAQRQGSM